MTTLPYNLDPNSEWPIDEMPAMPLRVGLAMVRMAMREVPPEHRRIAPAVMRQNRLAVQAADNKWRIQQSQLRNEAAARFRTRALGLAALAGASGAGSVLTMIIQHLLVK